MLDQKLEYPWHQKTWDQFAEARSRNRLPHALLVTGEEGIGKIEFAQRLAKSLLCFKPVDNQPCNQCNGCKTYGSSSNPDFMGIQIAEDKKQISVDQIRELSKFITLSRGFEAYRVILLQPVEAMNINAANSLLKSLEEPADKTIIILLATHLNQILPTIKSRCQFLILPKPTSNQSLEWLKVNCPEIKDSQAYLNLNFGRPLIALDSSDADINQAAELAGDILKVIEEKKSITEAAKIWEKSQHGVLLDWQLSWIKGFIKEEETGVKNKNEGVSLLGQYLNNIKRQIEIDSCWELYQQLLGQKKYIHTSVNPLMFIENMLTLWFKASHQCY